MSSANLTAGQAVSPSQIKMVSNLRLLYCTFSLLHFVSSHSPMLIERINKDNMKIVFGECYTFHCFWSYAVVSGLMTLWKNHMQVCVCVCV